MTTRVLCKAAMLLFLVPVLMITGCTKRYALTHNLEEPLPGGPTCYIGEMKDDLPADFSPEKKPSLEDIEKFKRFLCEALADKEFFSVASAANPVGMKYVLTGSIYDYKKGSGFLRFLFGAWAGAAKVTVGLQLAEQQSGQVIFAGNFTGAVTSGSESGDEMFKRLSKDFAKALRKQSEKRAKEAEKEPDKS